MVGVLTYAPVASGRASALCAPLPTDRGTVTLSVNVPATGNYRVWSRVLTADATKNSFYMQIDQTSCNVNVAATSIAANTWTWLDYQSGTAASKFDVSLTAGSHTIILAGKDDNVEVDRIILTQDLTCLPTGTGDNCANPPDTTPPIVAITAPAANSAITTTTTATVNATDDVAVAKVEYYIDGVLKSTDTALPYTYSLDPAVIGLGSHQLTARAYDAAGNAATSSALPFTVPDAVKPVVNLTSPAAGATISGTVALSATATDNVGVTKVEFYVDNVVKATVTTGAANVFTSSLSTSSLTNASHVVLAKAYDAAGNIQLSPANTVTVNNPVVPPADTTPPTVVLSAPVDGTTISGTSNLVATATDTSGIKQIQFYVDGVLKNTATAAPYSYALNTTSLTNGSHSFYAVATDASANANSMTSATVNALVSNASYIAEDINQDGHVNLLDFSLLSANFNKTGIAITTPRADINKDGSVNLLDFSLLSSKFGL